MKVRLCRGAALSILTAVFILFVLSGMVFAAEENKEHDFGKLDRYIEKEMKSCNIPGFSIGVIKDGRVIYTKGYGKADAQGDEVMPQTPFIIGSVSKSITALGIMQLAEAGKIELDRSIKDYIPWFELGSPDAASGITVRQLLNNMSGIRPDAEWKVAALKGDDTLEQLVRKFSKLDPPGAPGQKYDYSNVNYIILGELIAEVSGLSYEEYVKEHIFKPLDMKHSYVSIEDARKDGMANGYRPFFGILRPADLPYRKDFLPAYYIISSAEDMTKYMQAILGDGTYAGVEVISAEGLKEMHKPAARINSWSSYGMGWFVTENTIYHGGSTMNYQARVTLMPKDRLGVSIMFNTSTGLTADLLKVGYRDRINSGIISILYGEEPVAIPSGGLVDTGRLPLKAFYAIINVLMLLAVLLVVLSVLRLRSLGKRMKRKPSYLLRTALLLLAVNLAIPLYLLFLPAANSLKWSQVLYNGPDIGWFLFIMSFALLAVGLAKAFIIISWFRSTSGKKTGGTMKIS